MILDNGVVSGAAEANAEGERAPVSTTECSADAECECCACRIETAMLGLQDLVVRLEVALQEVRTIQQTGEPASVAEMSSWFL